MRRRAPWRTRWRAGGVVAVICVLSLLGAGPAAWGQQHPTHPGVVAERPASYTPDVLDGHVSAFAQVGRTMIVGGQFSQVEQGGTTYLRSNLFAFNVDTGTVSAAFDPVVDGEVYDLALTPDGADVVVGGAFHSVDGATGTSRIAEISVTNGTVAPGFTSPKPNGPVRDIAYANGVYYVSGDFSALGGHSRSTVAALAADGTDTGDVNLDVEGTNHGGQTKIQAMDISPDGSTMVLAGNFSSIDGQPRGQLAVVDLAPGSATLSPWNTQRMTPVCSLKFYTYTRDVAIDPTGSYFVVVNTGGPLGNQTSGLLCDSASRWEIDADPDAQPTWVDYTGGDTLTAAIVDTNAIYVGGHMRWLNNSYGRNSHGPGAVPRQGVGALDPLNGLPLSWNPGRRRGYGVFGFALTVAGLWTGSDTVGFGGTNRARLAFCRIASGTPIPPYMTATLPGKIVQLGTGTSSKVTRHWFDGTSLGAATPVASQPNWQTLRGTFVVDGVLYTGWAGGALRARTFDGTTFGPAQVVDLHRGFTDLPHVSTMFFDPSTHRLYYTLQTKDRLYYRYFAPESRTVGATRFKVDAPSTVVWQRLQGAFLVGQQLYFVSRVNGNLRSVGFDSTTGTTTSAAADVLGPTIDGVDFRAAGLVLIN